MSLFEEQRHMNSAQPQPEADERIPEDLRGYEETACKIAGVNPNDLEAKHTLWRAIDSWDYETPADANIAYSEPSVARLQLLRQIKPLLFDGMGFSNDLYDKLTTGNNAKFKGPREAAMKEALKAGRQLQPWRGLQKSVILRGFVEEHEDFLGGHVGSDKKWHFPRIHAPGFKARMAFACCRGEEIQSTSIPEFSSLSVAGRNIPKIDGAVQATLLEILDKRFPNGIRLNSVIDMNKLKNYYAEVTGKYISEDVADILSALKTVGIKHGDKVYTVSASGKQTLIELFNHLLLEDNNLFYYDEFYDAHADFLHEMHIFSTDLLRTILAEAYPFLWYHKHYCQTNRNATVESEILRCYETAVILSYDQLKDRLTYVPISSIKHELAYNSAFIWVKTGVYTHVCKIEFDKVECCDACSRIEEEVTAHGFASLASINVLSSVELNPNLSETAIKNGLFQMHLAERFEKRGNIITKKGVVLNSVAVFENFCRSHDSLTLNELLDYEKEINGSVHSQSLFIAYDNMIRTNRNTFVTDSEVQFDVDATDDALARFILGDVIPLRAVTSFMSFPYIAGYPWNLFMLESYCRRFSKRFGFQCLSVSSRNVGAIFKKAVKFVDYAGVLAVAVAVEPIELTPEAVGDFLFESGYVARRTSFVADVVAQARLLKERVI